MHANNIKIGLLVSAILLLLCFFAALSFFKSGEVIKTMAGKVQRCEVLGGGKVKSLSNTESHAIFHATIKAKNGSYIIANLEDCRSGMDVNILIKRGALYFNTLYAAEKI